jgi:RimJ/RimL family protein N-acetyltransferase
LARKASESSTEPSAKIPISVRPYEPRDAVSLFSENDPKAAAAEAGEIEWRKSHLAAGIPTCFVAVDDRTGAACYMQWLMGADQNSAIQQHLWGFPILKPHQALLENAYTPPAYRGQGIMAAAMWQIAGKAFDKGLTEVLTFVTKDNIPSLKGCEKAGFHPVMTHNANSYLFGLVNRHIFGPLPPPAS